MVGRHWVKISMAHSCQGNLQFDKSWGGKIGIEYTDKQSWIIFFKKKKKEFLQLSYPDRWKWLLTEKLSPVCNTLVEPKTKNGNLEMGFKMSCTVPLTKHFPLGRKMVHQLRIHKLILLFVRKAKQIRYRGRLINLFFPLCTWAVNTNSCT
jgi:hypothetical protein